MKPLLMMRTKGITGPAFAKHCGIKGLSKSSGNTQGINLPTGPDEYTGVLYATGENFAIGTALGYITPDNVDGLEINYLGSFGQTFWNLRLGPSGTTQIPAVTEVDVSLNGTSVIRLTWHATNLKYQGVAGEDLWALLAPHVGLMTKSTIKPV